MKVEYRNNISDDQPEECPDTAVMRYWPDKHNWIDVSVDRRTGSLTIRGSRVGIVVLPEAANTINVKLEGR